MSKIGFSEASELNVLVNLVKSITATLTLSVLQLRRGIFPLMSMSEKEVVRSPCRLGLSEMPTQPRWKSSTTGNQHLIRLMG